MVVIKDNGGLAAIVVQLIRPAGPQVRSAQTQPPAHQASRCWLISPANSTFQPLSSAAALVRGADRALGPVAKSI